MSRKMWIILSVCAVLAAGASVYFFHVAPSNEVELAPADISTEQECHLNLRDLDTRGDLAILGGRAGGKHQCCDAARQKRSEPSGHPISVTESHPAVSPLMNQHELSPSRPVPATIFFAEMCGGMRRRGPGALMPRDRRPSARCRAAAHGGPRARRIRG